MWEIKGSMCIENAIAAKQKVTSETFICLSEEVGD